MQQIMAYSEIMAYVFGCIILGIVVINIFLTVMELRVKYRDPYTKQEFYRQANDFLSEISSALFISAGLTLLIKPTLGYLLLTLFASLEITVPHINKRLQRKLNSHISENYTSPAA